MQEEERPEGIAADEAASATLLNDPNAKVLFRLMSESHTYKLVPSVDLKGISFPLASRALPRLARKETRDLLKQLSKSGILKPKFLDKFVICPGCSSPSVIARYNCVRCKSIDVDRLSILEHTACGFREAGSKFEFGTSLICPSCKQILSAGDYREIGIVFQCQACYSRFQSPNVTHKCTVCEQVFTFKEALYESLVEYELSDEGKRDLAIGEPIISSIEQLLNARGFSTVHNATIPTRSGPPQTFDLVATNPHGFLILANFVFSVTEDCVIGFFGKKYDANATLALLVCSVRPSPELIVTSHLYNIQLVFPSKDQTISDQIALILDNAADNKPTLGKGDPHFRGHESSCVE